MCNENSCCKASSLTSLKSILLIFTAINLLLCIIAVFIRAGTTKRYKDALILLDERNNNTSINSTFNKCSFGGLFNDELYCEVDGKRLYKPSDSVSFQSLFKNFPKVELIMDISRIIITIIFFLYIFFVLNKYRKYLNQNNTNNNSNSPQNQEKENFIFLLRISFIFLIILVCISSIFILIRAFTIGTNNDIGLYEEEYQNQFEKYTAINYIIDIVNIVLSSVGIGFILRMKKFLKEGPPQNNNRPIIIQPIQRPPIQRSPYPIQNINPPSTNYQINIHNVRVENIVSYNNGIHPIDE